MHPYEAAQYLVLMSNLRCFSACVQNEVCRSLSVIVKSFYCFYCF